MPDQFGDQHAALDARDQRRATVATCHHMHIGRPRARRAADATRGVASGGEAQLARRSAFHQPAGQHALVDQRPRPGRQPLAIERLGPHPAQPVRIVEDGDAVGEHRRFECVEQKAGPPCDGAAGDCAEQMADQARRHAAVEDHRHRGGVELDRTKPCHRALAGELSGCLGAVEVFEPARAMPRRVALHLGTLAREHADADAVRRCRVAAHEAAAGGQRNDCATAARRSALGIGDAGHRTGGILGGKRPILEGLAGDLGWIAHVEVFEWTLGEQFTRRETRKRVLGRFLRHRPCPLYDKFQRRGRQVRGRYACRTLALEQPQSDLLSLRPANVLKFAQAHRHAGRSIADIKTIGSVGTEAAGVCQGSRQAIKRHIDGKHGAELGVAARAVNAPQRRRRRGARQSAHWRGTAAKREPRRQD